MELRTNCRANAATLSPFGGMLHPKQDEQDQLFIFDRSNDENWMMLTPAGVPVPHTQLGETVVQRWFWNGPEALEITGAWLTGGGSGSLVGGSRARATFADFLITEATFRVGLSRPPTVRAGLSRRIGRGPWVNLEEDPGESGGEMSEAMPGWVFGACFKLSDITWLRGNRASIAFGDGTAALTVNRGVFNCRDDQGDYVKSGAGELAVDLLDAIAACSTGPASDERRAFIESLADGDLAQDFDGRRDTLLEIPK